ncbi:hypothetical protein EJB05_02672, partial [Eragrostis curvula]
MAARLGLLPHAALRLASASSSSSRALTPSRARLPYPPPPPPFPAYCRAAFAAPPRLRARRALIAPRAMSSSSGNPYAAELAAAKKAVTLAARLCQTVQQDIVQSGIQSKADKSPVTVADYGSQILVSLVLKMEAPGSFSLVAEEDSEELRKEGAEEILENITDLVNETIFDDGSYSISFSKDGILSAIDDGKSEGGPSGRHWVLDPIDGTKGFLRGDQYAIALALIDEGKVVLGVLACPNLPLSSISNLNGGSSEDQVGALFSATIGCGTEVEYLDGSPPQKISVCSIDNPVNASFFESYESAHSLHDLTSSIAKKLGVQAPPVRIDSQAKYGALARGDGAIYLRFPHQGYREKIWDHAAGSIVVTEAGGIVTDASGNELDFSKGRFLDLDSGIIATNKQLMPSLLKAVQEAIKEQNQAASLLHWHTCTNTQPYELGRCSRCQNLKFGLGIDSGSKGEESLNSSMVDRSAVVGSGRCQNLKFQIENKSQPHITSTAADQAVVSLQNRGRRPLCPDFPCFTSLAKPTPPPSPFMSQPPEVAGNPYGAELAAAKKAVSLAARLCQRVQQDILQSDVQSKADRTPVTVADYGSQVLVSLVLKRELPSHSFSMVAEEDSKDLRNDGAQEILGHITNLVNETIVSDGSYEVSLSKDDILTAIDGGKSEGGPTGRHWILDPIDGTKGFIRGDQYAVALGLLDEGRVVLGVLGCPNLPLKSSSKNNGGSSRDVVGSLFSATIGCGAEVEALGGSKPEKISVCPINNPVDASFFESYEASHSKRDLTSSIAEKLGVQAPPVRMDSQAKYGALARGDGAIFLRIPHKSYKETVWDHAAGSIVVTEAGGMVKDASGNDLDFSKGRHLDRDRGIIATNKYLMPLVLKAVQEAIKEEQQAAALINVYGYWATKGEIQERWVERNY